MDGNAMSSRILRTIANIINSDSDIQEFTIIPTAENTKNKSPVLFEEHHLGLESWCIKHVYQYACSTLLDCKEQLAKKKLAYHKMEDLNHLLIGIILINPDVGTFWNMKRELVESDVLTVENELYFSKIVLTHKSKSNEAFSYRRWLLKRYVNKLSSNHLPIPLNILQSEFSVVHMASEKSPNNYHSWNHRIWCMENIAQDSNIAGIVYSELSYTQEWINTHISEHAGYHYRQYLIKLVKEHKKIVTVFESYYNFVVKSLLNLINDGEYGNLVTYLLGKPVRTKLLEESCSIVNFICILLYDLFVLIDKLNELFQDHECLYYHRRFVVYQLLKVPFEYHSLEFTKRAKPHETSPCGNITNTDTLVDVQSNSEVETRWPNLFKFSYKPVFYNLYEILSNSENAFLTQNNGMVQCAKYRKWLSHIVGFE